MMLILDFELKENSNESPLLSLHDADVLLTWRLAKSSVTFLPSIKTLVHAVRSDEQQQQPAEVIRKVRDIMTWSVSAVGFS